MLSHILCVMLIIFSQFTYTEQKILPAVMKAKSCLWHSLCIISCILFLALNFDDIKIITQNNVYYTVSGIVNFGRFDDCVNETRKIELRLQCSVFMFQPNKMSYNFSKSSELLNCSGNILPSYTCSTENPFFGCAVYNTSSEKIILTDWINVTEMNHPHLNTLVMVLLIVFPTIILMSLCGCLYYCLECTDCLKKLRSKNPVYIQMPSMSDAQVIRSSQKHLLSPPKLSFSHSHKKNDDDNNYNDGVSYIPVSESPAVMDD